MGARAVTFLSSFNRIEKWLREQLNNPGNMGFAQIVRHLSKRSDLSVKKYENDLLQISQLRNAIVHEQIGDDFIIAEPNQWVLDQIQLIEHELLQPERVLPHFAKKVTGFEQDISLKELLKIIADKRYSQFPLYKKGEFQGLLTLRGIGYWLAKESLTGQIDLTHKTAKELILKDGKKTNYAFVSGQTTINEVEEMFRKDALLDAILITKKGNENGNLLGIIRPRDIF
ncbi:MAG TPA: CBS domain-containing protein [Tetragenococcus sp.]|nr:CBS domain-containing protein [Tetragenococcus sp.]